jgi:hypothetical protein
MEHPLPLVVEELGRLPHDPEDRETVRPGAQVVLDQGVDAALVDVPVVGERGQCDREHTLEVAHRQLPCWEARAARSAGTLVAIMVTP